MCDGPVPGTNGVIVKSASSEINPAVLLARAASASSRKNFVQLFDRQVIINRLHVLGAYENACATHAAGDNISKSLVMEMLLFVAMTRQINEAVEMVGIKDNRDFLVFSNSKKSYDAFKGVLSKATDFNPLKSQSYSTAKKWGIRETDHLDERILQMMALSRLQ